MRRGLVGVLLALLLAGGVGSDGAYAEQSRLRLRILPLECVFETVNDGSNQVVYITPEECGQDGGSGGGGGNDGGGTTGGGYTPPSSTTTFLPEDLLDSDAMIRPVSYENGSLTPDGEDMIQDIRSGLTSDVLYWMLLFGLIGGALAIIGYRVKKLVMGDEDA